MLISVLMACVWALAAVTDIWPVAFALGWTWHVARLWRAGREPSQCLSLCWQAHPLGAWQVAEWGGVEVLARSLWDGQSAFLLHLRAVDGVRQAWLWVRDDGGRDIHRLRTLLGVPQAAPKSPVA